MRASTANGSYTAISQQTLSTLALTDSLIGDYIKVEVNAANANGAGTAVLSASVGPVTDLPLSPTPTFGSTTSTSDGFTVSITNYSANYTYSFTETSGSATNNAALVTVTGMAGGSSSTVTVRASRNGYRSASANVTGSARVAPTTTAPTTTTSSVAPVLEIVVNATPSTVAQANQGQASVAAVVTTTTIAGTQNTIPSVSVPKPSKTPVASTTTVAVVVATTTTVPGGAKPAAVKAAPSIPAVATGKAGVKVGSANQSATVTRIDNQLVVSAGPLKATLASINDQGTVGSLDTDGNVRLKSGDSIRITLAGFKPGSTVEAWLFSTPVLMGTAKVGSDGTVTGLFTIPKKVDKGAHRIAVVAKTNNGKPATLTVGVMVGEIQKGPNVTVWLIVAPILLAVVGALTLPATRRRRKARNLTA